MLNKHAEHRNTTQGTLGKSDDFWINAPLRS